LLEADVDNCKVDLEDGRDSVDPADLEIPAESTAVNPLAVSKHNILIHILFKVVKEVQEDLIVNHIEILIQSNT
jgi:hypothetical protein